MTTLSDTGRSIFEQKSSFSSAGLTNNISNNQLEVAGRSFELFVYDLDIYDINHSSTVATDAVGTWLSLDLAISDARSFASQEVEVIKVSADSPE